MIPLEDNFTDVIGKAQRGHGMPDEKLAAAAGVAVTQVQKAKNSEINPEVLAKIAEPLKLNAKALIELAEKRWYPQVEPLAGLKQFNTVFGDMTVNAYLVWDSSSGQAAVFDTGADASGILDAIKKENLTVTAIFLTHTHGDHVFDLDRLVEKTGAPVWVSERESIEGAQTFAPGKTFQIGTLKVETRSTWGHSKGGTTYVIRELARPVAVVGDALFASSMGGGGVSYADALATNRKEIFSLPEETILCPGHGPFTTVGIEKSHNPFFAN